MSSLAWKLNRLRVMTFGEILFRTRRSCSNVIEKFRLHRGWQPVPDEKTTPLIGLFGQDASVITEWKNNFQLDTSKLQQYLDGKIDFFRHKNLFIGIPVNWHRDPVTGIESPLSFGKTLNYRDDRLVGKVKFTWELGRHQHLVPLAVAYVISGNSRYKNNVVEQIQSWIKDNPYGMGIHWCTSLEASIRMISWSLVHSLILLKDGGNGLFDSDIESEKLGISIYQHCYFIKRFLSLHSSANNHLLGEFTGLWVACNVFNLGKKGKHWAQFAKKNLELEATKQVYIDGVNKEQAFYYHMWVLEYFLFAQQVAARSNDEFSVDFKKRIPKMANFLKDISPLGGEPPQVGDADDGFVSRFDPCWPEKPYLEMIDTTDAVLGFCEPVRSQKAFWYRAISEQSFKESDGKWQRDYPVAYNEGGYAILGNQNCHLVMDAGDLGYLGIAAHGHADALSFCLAIDGIWWLVDPGTYVYHDTGKWRKYFRGSTAHNTVVIDDTDQSTFAGPFIWTHKAHASLLSIREQGQEQIAIGKHDGYQHLGIIHQRTISIHSGTNEIKIVDNLTGGKNVKTDIYFHFSPEIKVFRENESDNWIISHPNNSRYLIFVPDKQWEMNVFNGQENPDLGWYSPSLEKKTPACTLRGTATYSEEFSSSISLLIR